MRCAPSSSVSGGSRNATSVVLYPSRRVSKMAEIWRMTFDFLRRATRSITSFSLAPTSSPMRA